ncbi:MAG: hypothetical protein J6A23_13200, partial [Thermoguttaceae bacterium]|nr:hypothetical protein [Thermoguttaceae bacterium]
ETAAVSEETVPVSWTGEVWLGGTQWAYLTGIEALDAEEAQSVIYTAVMKKDDYVDADKEDPYSGGVDCNMCWAAASANMLDYSGWGDIYPQGNHSTVADAIFTELYREYFQNAGGNIENALRWFFTGDYGVSDPENYLKDAGNTIEGFYSLEELASVYRFADCTDVTPGVMQEMVRNLELENAVGVAVGGYDANGNRTSGHALTLYGYVYDTAYSVDELERYTGLIVADSNDRTDKLTTYTITYDAAAGKYHFPHEDIEYGGKSGYLECFSFLSTPENTHAPGELVPFIPRDYGWSDCLFVQSGAGSTVPADHLPEGSDVYVSFSVINRSVLPSGVFSCKVTIDGGELSAPISKTYSYRSIDQRYFYCTSDKNFGQFAPGTYTLTLQIDSGNAVDEYDEANNTVVRTFTVGEPEVSDDSIYDETEWNQFRAFLEQTDANGVKNGTKLDPAYEADKTATWSGITWKEIDGVKFAEDIHWGDQGSLDLAGKLDLSGCASLETLVLFAGIDELDLRGCSALKNVWLEQNDFTFLNLSAQNTLQELILEEDDLETVLLSEEVLGKLQILIDPMDPSWQYSEGAGTLTEDGIFTPASLPFTAFNANGTRSIAFQSSSLSAPMLAAAASGSDSVTVTVGNVPNAEGYTLEYAAASDFTNAQTLSFTASGEQTISGLAKNTTYFFRVKAEGSDPWSDSPWSETQSVTTERVLLFPGYDETECLQIQAFLEQTDADGVKNGTKLNSAYDADDPATWSDISWKTVDGVERIGNIYWHGKGFVGTLDLSACTALTTLYCSSNALTSLNVSQNTALTTLSCGWNALTSLDVRQNAALKSLDCRSCSLTALDVSRNSALTWIDCSYNSLTALDVSQNAALSVLVCGFNAIEVLDVSRNPLLTIISCS